MVLAIMLVPSGIDLLLNGSDMEILKVSRRVPC